MILNDLYAAIVRRRRERYAARPDLRRRLRRPVISVGNLALGGRGKTPMVAFLGRLLMDMGERPAILSRGYARRRMDEGVVVVRDPDGIRCDLDRAGDEPLMLARQLPGASVLASADRYLAGTLAEHQFGATVHVLDDAFQHLQMERDIDIVLVGGEDVARPWTLPGGRLREPLDALVAADAIITADDDVCLDLAEADVPVFAARRTLGTPESDMERGPMFAFAGIASPGRFFDDLRAAGWAVRGTMAFRDHHAYSRRDLARVYAAARAAGAAAVLTTEKDFTRLRRFRPFPMATGYVPLTMEPDPLPEFRRWLAGSLSAARDIIVD
ncbi:MAG: tetraacyldisaccharide 4'-kinase [Acidobacteria bacterium RIFCSPLOWO2_02_FULL_67_36]|nr:MAG: tetraacyldisaccharide 4'-kinase [Acidobacteria bacterium RIFCSPLOWO2_02_FULL_67_36]OFW21492.1 MAG: tetraacyldisaccharide 4'-kinase [Acidobacteria bacterium RIFCSPLOWO2_12_FULL_66_21]